MNRKYIGPTTIKQKLSEQNDRCKNCNKKILNPESFHLDHIKALKDGGNDDYRNMQILCIDCHRIKTKEEGINEKLIKEMNEMVICNICNKVIRSFTLNQAEHNLNVHKMSKHKEVEDSV